MRENVDQNNSEYEHFSRSDCGLVTVKSSCKFPTPLKCAISRFPHFTLVSRTRSNYFFYTLQGKSSNHLEQERNFAKGFGKYCWF